MNFQRAFYGVEQQLTANMKAVLMKADAALLLLIL